MVKIVFDNASLIATTSSARVVRNVIMVINGVVEYVKSLFCFGMDLFLVLFIMMVCVVMVSSKTSIKALKGENRIELKYS